MLLPRMPKIREIQVKSFLLKQKNNSKHYALRTMTVKAIFYR